MRNVLQSEDIEARINAVRQCWVSVLLCDGRFEIIGLGKNNFIQPKTSLHLGNSGTSARLLMGLLGGSNIKVSMVGD